MDAFIKFVQRCKLFAGSLLSQKTHRARVASRGHSAGPALEESVDFSQDITGRYLGEFFLVTCSCHHCLYMQFLCFVIPDVQRFSCHLAETFLAAITRTATASCSSIVDEEIGLFPAFSAAFDTAEDCFIATTSIFSCFG